MNGKTKGNKNNILFNAILLINYQFYYQKHLYKDIIENQSIYNCKKI